MINLMLEDRLPYKVIIDELAESGRGITPQSLTKWLQSGYEDYLKNRENIEEAKSQAEFAADLLRDLGDIDVSTIHRACLMLTSLQIFNAIDQYGNEALRKMLHVKPASYIALRRRGPGRALFPQTSSRVRASRIQPGRGFASKCAPLRPHAPSFRVIAPVGLQAIRVFAAPAGGPRASATDDSVAG